MFRHRKERDSHKEQNNPDKQLSCSGLLQNDFQNEDAEAVTQVAEFSHLKAMKKSNDVTQSCCARFFPQNDTGAIKNCKTAEDGKMISSN